MTTRLLRLFLCAAIAATCGSAQAATVLEYRHEGECATEFERMAIDGLRLRIDMRVDGIEMTSLIDDEEQLMHQVMHDSRSYMTMESDDDAVDFNSDVARSTLLHARNEAYKVTGLDNDALIAQARAAQVAACPGMAQLAFGDPDYPEAAARCAERMAADAAAQAPADRESAIARAQLQARPTRANAPASPAPKPEWTTTRIEREAGATQVDGRACTTERVMRGTTVLREDCMAAIDALALEPRAQRRLARMAKVGAGLASGIVELHPELQQQEREGPPAISLRRVCHADGRVAGSSTLEIRERVAIDPAQFELPAGYEPLQIGAPSTESPDEALELLERMR
ncbi:MAG: hypothetical protein EOP90_12250 [Lysobacteraceae bacterium]|nr:MAG: hypothetical protein EOP90_12250 [Xanthomonadaceae bacterium]